jgi:hypothetical protein
MSPIVNRTRITNLLPFDVAQGTRVSVDGCALSPVLKGPSIHPGTGLRGEFPVGPVQLAVQALHQPANPALRVSPALRALKRLSVLAAEIVFPRAATRSRRRAR